MDLTKLYKEKIKSNYGILDKISNTHLELAIGLFDKYSINPELYNQDDPETLNILGLYYKYIHIDPDLMKKYFLLGINKFNLNCMCNLAFYYFNYRDEILTKKYFLMYLDFAYELNFDTESEKRIGQIIGIFIPLICMEINLDSEYFDLDDSETLDIIGLYCLLILNNKEKYNEFVFKKIEKKYSINFESSHDPDLIIKIFDSKKKISQNDLTKFNLNDIFTIDLLSIYADKVLNNSKMVKKLYKIGIELGWIDFISKLANYYKKKLNKKLADKYELEYKIKLLESKYQLDSLELTNKSNQFKELILEIFSYQEFESINFDKYDMTDYNVLLCVGLYWGKIKLDYIQMIKHIAKSIKIKYNLILSPDKDSIPDNLIELIYHLFYLKYEIDTNTLKSSDPDILNLLGFYFIHIKKSHEQTIKYFLKSIRKHNWVSMYNLGKYYMESNQKELGERYLIMYVEFRFGFDLDTMSLNKKTILIDMFTSDNFNIGKYDLEDIETLEVLGLYYACVHNNLELSNQYLTRSIEFKYDILFGISNPLNLNILVKIFNSDTINPAELDNDDKEILYLIGCWFEKKESEYTLAEKYYLKSVELGSIESAYRLGLLYKNKNKLANTNKMIKYFQIGSDNGHVKSIYNLGMYYEGIKDYKPMEKLYARAIKLDCVDSMFRFGFYLMKTKIYDLGEKMLILAINSTKYSGDAEDIKAHYLLGKYYIETKSDPNKIKQYLEYAIKCGCVKSMGLLGDYYLNIEPDIDLGIKYHKLAVKSKSVESCETLGNLYKCSDSEIYNKKKAIKYYLKGVELYSIESIYELGHIYELESNFKLMKKYYLLAISQVHILSMYRLGLYYKNQKKSLKLSSKYFKMAIEYDHENSIIEYADCKYKAKSYELAITWYKKIFDLGHWDIISNWAHCYLHLKQPEQLELMVEQLESDPNKNITSFQIVLIKLYDELAKYYKDNKDNDNVYKYYVKGIILSDSIALKNLEEFVDKPLKLYNLLMSIEEKNKNNMIKNKISELLDNSKVRFYSNKITLFSKLNNIKECLVCYSNKIHINFDCGHDVCVDCYCSMDTCQFRCDKKSEYLSRTNSTRTNVGRRNGVSIVLSDPDSDNEY